MSRYRSFADQCLASVFGLSSDSPTCLYALEWESYGLEHLPGLCITLGQLVCSCSSAFPSGLRQCSLVGFRSCVSDDVCLEQCFVDMYAVYDACV